jgi:RNA polymerase sigma-70 factor, ECF subfamily
VDSRARTWADELGGTGTGQHAGEAALRLQDLLLDTARAELDRRQGQLPADVAPDALAPDAAAAALAAVIADLGERGTAPFPVWAAKFVMAEVSAKIAQQQWRAGVLRATGRDWAAQLAARLGLAADVDTGTGVLGSLGHGVEQDLTEQQRIVFHSVLLGGVPVDVLALEFGSSRSAIYKSLFEARRRLGDRLAADGHDRNPLSRLPSAWPSGLADLLAVTPGDAGCEVTFQEVDTYVSGELSGGDPGQDLAAVRVHLASCLACQQDYQGLLAASRATRLSGASVHPDVPGSSCW